MVVGHKIDDWLNLTNYQNVNDFLCVCVCSYTIVGIIQVS